jgi:hypothetical protein
MNTPKTYITLNLVNCKHVTDETWRNLEPTQRWVCSEDRSRGKWETKGLTVLLQILGVTDGNQQFANYWPCGTWGINLGIKGRDPRHLRTAIWTLKDTVSLPVYFQSLTIQICPASVQAWGESLNSNWRKTKGSLIAHQSEHGHAIYYAAMSSYLLGQFYHEI